MTRLSDKFTAEVYHRGEIFTILNEILTDWYNRMWADLERAPSYIYPNVIKVLKEIGEEINE